MTSNRTYRKIAASMLLLCLLFTTIVQLSHSHPSGQTAVIQLKKTAAQQGKENCSVPGADTRCFLCEYQLTRDADFSHSLFHFTAIYKIAVTTSPYCEKIPAAFHNCFESRGPPATAAV